MMMSHPKNKKYMKKCDDDPKNKKYMKKRDDDMLVGFVKSMSSGYSLDAEFNFSSNELSRSKFE